MVLINRVDKPVSGCREFKREGICLVKILVKLLALQTHVVRASAGFNSITRWESLHFEEVWLWKTYQLKNMRNVSIRNVFQTVYSQLVLKSILIENLRTNTTQNDVFTLKYFIFLIIINIFSADSI